MFSLVFYYWHSLNSSILDYAGAESLWRLPPLAVLTNFFFKRGACKYWVLCLLRRKPSGRLKAEDQSGWGESRISRMLERTDRKHLLPHCSQFLLSLPSLLLGTGAAYLFQRSPDLSEWAIVTLKAAWSKFPFIVIIPHFIQELSSPAAFWAALEPFN